MRSFIAFTALCAVLFIKPAGAQETPIKDGSRIEADDKSEPLVVTIDGEPVAMLDGETSHADTVRIEADQKAKAFIFIIDDEPVAMLDKSGLRVVNSIEYGYTLTDTGPNWIKDKIAARGTEAAND